MKATLEFDLPDDQHAFNLANKAAEMHSLILGCHERLRMYVKHGNPDNESAMDVIEDVKFRLSVVLDYE
jgi:hypothetical protein